MKYECFVINLYECTISTMHTNVLYVQNKVAGECFWLCLSYYYVFFVIISFPCESTPLRAKRYIYDYIYAYQLSLIRVGNVIIPKVHRAHYYNRYTCTAAAAAAKTIASQKPTRCRCGRPISRVARGRI